MMTTVLPTPAPPNSPILPPRRYGSSRSMTLMPVSNICSLGGLLFEARARGDGWASARPCSTGPMLSTGSPMTFSTRPRVSLPTGTVTGPPRLIAFMPRTMPSVGCSAMVRTRPSPICCATSTMTSTGVGTSKPSLVMRMAVLMTGIWCSGNWMSTAGPAIWITWPSAVSVVVAMMLLAAYAHTTFAADTFTPKRRRRSRFR